MLPRVRIPIPLILASASERRRAILSAAGYAFEVREPGDAEEAVSSAPTPADLALEKACIKAEVIASQLKGAPALVLGADTIVVAGAEVLGKPLDRADAVRILSRLSGTRHCVITGLVMRPAPGTFSAVRAAATTWVTFRTLTPAEIEAYVATGEADGKAGAYAIQERGDRFVERLEGSYSNVVGFPLELFEERAPLALREWGFECPTQMMP
jgi:septum formation protein